MLGIRRTKRSSPLRALERAVLQRRPPAAAPGGVWAMLRKKPKASRSRRVRGDPGLWSVLAERMDVAKFKPRLAPDLEVKEFKLRWGNDYALVANPRDLLHYRLEPDEVGLLALMDGTRTVEEIVVERLQGAGGLDLSSVADLVLALQAGNFLAEPFVDVPVALQRALHPERSIQQRILHFIRSLQIEWKGADRLVSWLYHHGLRWFFRRSVLLGAGVVSVTGLIAFLGLTAEGGYAIGGASAAGDGMILLGLNYFLTFVHELGHAVVLTHNGRRVKSAGFMIYFASPAFFVESSNGLMMDRRQRIMQSLGGPYAESIVAGAAALVVAEFPEWGFAPLLYKFAALNYLLVFFNLVPLLELDGYWILSDLIQVPDLRPRSLSFMRHDLWHKIRARVALSRQEVGLALYGILGVAFTIFALTTGLYFWKQLFGGLVAKLWHGGVTGRLVLIALGLFVGGPILRAAIDAARWVGRRVAGGVAALRFHLETGWRVEAAGLIDALPLFDEVPEEALNDLAGRVRLRRFAAGQPVVRQGERSSAFYVVRSGTMQVLEEGAGTRRVVRFLGRGEAFGELGVLTAAPRRATVRALEDAEVFEIDRGSFERLLSGVASLEDLPTTFQDVSELGELPCFAHLESDQLGELLRHGEWVTANAGDEIVTGGQAADAFYAIRSGQVDILRRGRVVNTLRAGAFFGELGLLTNSPRNATVRARTPVRAYRLSRKGFDRLVRRAFRKGALAPNAAVERVKRH